jgi:ABC-type lipoprotein release transport system permease subunit
MIVVTSVVVGLIAILLNDGLSIGMIQQIFENRLGSHVSHIQIHKEGFNDNKVIQNYISDLHRVEELLKERSDIQFYSRRVITFGLLSSALNSSGGVIVGVEPTLEENVTTIKNSVVEGRYLSGKKDEVIIGKKLAEKLSVGIGDKVVGMASTLSGRVGSDLFRIVGLYQTVSSEFDKAYIFISLNNAQEMLEIGNGVSEFAVTTSDRKRVEPVKDEIARTLGSEYEVLSYADIMPLMLAQMEIYKESTYIVYLIVGLAMIFGIINTMLMSVFERIREFGVLMAIGMKNIRLFFMVLIEAFLLGIMGTAIGLVVGAAIYFPLSAIGIDLGMFSESLTSFGCGAIIYPVLTVESLINTLLIIPLIAVLGAIYPAIRAVRLEPMNAIRYV